MKRFTPFVVVAVLALAPAGAVWADDLDVTMDVVPANASPNNPTDEIKLPDTASARAQEASAFGLGVANQARELKGDLGRDFGKAVSEAARAKNQTPNLPPQSRRP
jgi:hypothetical protein